MITVDQLRADLPMRLLARFPEGGFRRFFEEGVVFDEAHYAHAITETAVGHATLFTGALPREHGIVGNAWFDPGRGAQRAAVDDPDAPLVGAEGPGRSPRALRVETVGDRLLEETSGRAHVLAVSAKDRGAIVPAGARGMAAWLDDQAGTFVTSQYYGRPLPEWTKALTSARFASQTWTLSQDEERYVAEDDRPWELAYPPFGRTFPHALPNAASKQLTRALKRTPFADELVLDFVRALLEHEPFGADDVPDLLAISFSATDYVGHAFGPQSREAEDNLLRLDRTLAGLLSLLERRVGAGRVLVVLSADHGVCEAPEWFLSRGEDAGRIDAVELVRHTNRALRQVFGIEQDLVRGFAAPTLVLDEAAIAAAGLSLHAIEQKAAELLTRFDGVAGAYARSELMSGLPIDDADLRRVAASVHPERSGHVYVLQKPHWIFAEADEAGLTATHGTPYAYDTHVPIYVLGPGLRAAHVNRPVDVRGVAPTVARWLGIGAPRGASAPALDEASPR
jgi:arylsulfatase A-like enzyme